MVLQNIRVSNGAQHPNAENAPPQANGSSSRPKKGLISRVYQDAAARRRTRGMGSTTRTPKYRADQAKRRADSQPRSSSVKFNVSPGITVSAIDEAAVASSSSQPPKSIPISFPKELNRPMWKDVDRDVLYSMEPDLAGMDMPFILDSVAGISAEYVKLPPLVFEFNLILWQQTIQSSPHHTSAARPGRSSPHSRSSHDRRTWSPAYTHARRIWPRNAAASFRWLCQGTQNCSVPRPLPRAHGELREPHRAARHTFPTHACTGHERGGAHPPHLAAVPPLADGLPAVGELSLPQKPRSAAQELPARARAGEPHAGPRGGPHVRRPARDNVHGASAHPQHHHAARAVPEHMRAGDLRRRALGHDGRDVARAADGACDCDG